MAADAELGVQLNIDESAIEEVQDRELELGGGGDLSPSQRNERQGVISGGFRSALAATGLIGILASLKPITATVSSILGILGRSIVPVLEVIADVIRPINEAINNVVQNLESESGREAVGTSISVLEQSGIAPFNALAEAQDLIGGEGGTNRASNPSQSEALINLANALSEIATGQANGTPDLSGEATKIDIKNRIESDADKLGEFE